MKKLLFIIALGSAFIFNACDPMKDINDDLDAVYDNADETARFLKDLTVAPESYTLTDEDYELSSNSSVANYKNFSSSALPKDYLPEILNQLFSGEDAQSMLVTYNYYSRPVTDEDNAYVISSDEYGEMGQSYSNFSDEDEAEALIGKLLDRKVYATEAGAEMTVEYTLFSTYEDRYIQVNEDGTSEEVDYASDAVEVTDEIYEATGNGKYKNFYKIENALEDLATYAVDSGLAPITYEALVYLNYLPEYVVYMYDGSNWVVKQSVMPVSEELNYSLNSDDITQSYWWADPAIKITLNGDDYAIFPGGGDAGGTAKYGNFDLRSGYTPGTDTEKLVEMIGEMLDTNYAAVEDQQYLVTYAYYDGGSGVATIRIIKTGGVWVEYSE